MKHVGEKRRLKKQRENIPQTGKKTGGMGSKGVNVSNKLVFWKGMIYEMNKCNITELNNHSVESCFECLFEG